MFKGHRIVIPPTIWYAHLTDIYDGYQGIS